MTLTGNLDRYLDLRKERGCQKMFDNEFMLIYEPVTIIFLTYDQFRAENQPDHRCMIHN